MKRIIAALATSGVLLSGCASSHHHHYVVPHPQHTVHVVHHYPAATHSKSSTLHKVITKLKQKVSTKKH